MTKLVENGPSQDALPPRPTKPKQRQRRLTDDQIDALVAKYEAGASVAQVAKDHGIHITTATAHLNRRGIPIRQQKMPLTRDELPRLLELKAQGWTNPQIASHYGCTRQAVQLALRRAQILREHE